MPKKIRTGFKYIERTREHFDLGEDIQPTSPLQLLEGVRPVTDFDRQEDVHGHVSETVSVTATGLFAGLTIPDGERWYITHLYGNLSTGTYTITDLAWRSQPKNTYIYADTFGATTVSRYPGQVAILPVTLEQFDEIVWNCNAHTTTGNFVTNVWRKRMLIGR